MIGEAIQRGFEVFVHDGDKAIGAVRDVKPHGRPEIVVYVENAGDFVVPLTAVQECCFRLAEQRRSVERTSIDVGAG